MSDFVPRTPLERRVDAALRRLCLALPGVEETASWGHPNYRTKTRIFAAIGAYGGEVSIGLDVGPEAQSLLVEDPRFFRTPYVGSRGWASYRVDAAFDEAMLRDLVRKAHARAAPPTRARSGDAGKPGKAPQRRVRRRPD